MAGELVDLCSEEELRKLVLREQLEALRAKGRRERHELLTQGFDDYLQLLGGPPTTNVPTSVGIKIPTLPSSANGGLPYVALCAAFDLDKGERFVGFDQYVSIAAQLPGGSDSPMPPYTKWERDQLTCGWRFVDVPPPEWFVTIEAKSPGRRKGPSNSASFTYEDSDSPSMLYETVGFPAIKLVPGYLALNAYTPPQMLGSSWYVCRDLHYPMQKNAMCSMRYVAHGTVRVRVYCRIWQTDPSVRTDTIAGLSATQVEFAAESLAPEDSFLQVFPNKVQYRAVGVRALADKFTRRDVR